MSDHPRPVVIGGLVVGVLAVSASAVLARFAMGDDPAVLTSDGLHAPALAVAFWRTLGGAVVLGPFALRAQRRPGRALAPARRRQLAWSGVALAAHFALFQGSIALTTVASSVTLATMSPLFVALGAWRWLGERTRRRTWVGMAMTMVGALVIGLADASTIELGMRALIGDAMAFTSALAVTGYLLIGRAARRDVAASTYSAVVYAWAAALLLVLCLALGVPLWGFSPTTWLAIGGILVGPQLLGHTVFNTLLGSVRPTIVSVVVLTEPVGATVLAWLLLSELPATLFWVGAPLVLVGVAVATARRPPAGARFAATDRGRQP